MEPSPPRFATRMLARTLRRDPAAPAILGDLHEEYVTRVARRGAGPAGRWYVREAFALAAGRLLLGARPGHATTPRTLAPPMKTPWHTLAQDLHSARRWLRHNPGFAAVAVLVIGLGVGASTAVYSVMRPLMLAPLPFEDPGELVWIANDGDRSSLSSVTSRTSNLRDFRSMSRSFDGIAGFNAFSGQTTYNLMADGRAEQLSGYEVTSDLLDVLGVRPAVGRNFTDDEGVRGGPAAVVLSHGLWVRRFAADPGLIGSTVSLNQAPYEVVGVLPPSFDFAEVFVPGVSVDILLPFPVDDQSDRIGNTMSFVGRLRDGATAATAAADLDGVLRRLEEAEPDRWGLGAVVTPLQEHVAGPFRGGMTLLAVAAGCVMLIVCTNISNMLLARSPKRRREVAVRQAMGATRDRIVRQLLAESFLLSVGGGLVGVGIAFVVTHLVATANGLTIPMLGSVQVSLPALGFSAGLAVLTGIIIGVAPAFQVASGGESAALRGTDSRAGGGSRAGRFRDALVVAEVALACVLLVVGGLLLRSFGAVLDVDLGYDPSQAVAWQLNPSGTFETEEARAEFFRQVTAAVLEIPGVESAGLIDALPLGRNRTWSIQILGAEYRGEDSNYDVFPHIAGPGYTEAMGIPVVEGRGLSEDDRTGADGAVLINESAAARLFPGRSALGHEIVLWSGNFRIVGVVGDVRHRGLERDSGTQLYFPFAQVPDAQTLDLVLRSSLSVERLVPQVRETLSGLDAGMPTDRFWTLESTVREATSPRRFTLALLAAFAATALILAAVGIYGVLSYTVSERIPEIGIRMALGATSQSVRRRVVGRTLAMSGAGVVIGLLAAVASASLVGSQLYGVEPTDPLTFGAMAAMLLVVATLSGWIPAVRASRVESAAALRETG